MSREVKTGMTDYSVTVFIPDSASTDGSGKTGLVAANLTVSGVRVETDNDVTVTDYTSSLNNLALLTTAHTDWGLLEVSSTLAPGLYRLDIADAIFASGAWSAVVYVMVTTSAAAATPMEFILIPQSPIDGVLLAPTTHTNAVIPTVTTLTGHTAQTGDSYARLGAPAGASVSADVAAVKSETATILSDTNDIQTRIPAALVSGRMDASVGAMAANVLTASALATDAVTEIQAGLATPTNITAGTITTATNVTAVNGLAAGVITAASIAADAITDAKVAADVTIASVTGAVGSVTGAVGSVTGAVGSVTGNVGGNVAGTVASVVGAVGSVAGQTLANLDVAVSTLSTAANLATVAGYIDTEVAAIKTVTDRLDTAIELDGAVYRLTTNALEQAPSGGGGGGLDAAGVRAAIGLASANLDTQLSTIDDFLDTEVAAIKAKTDNLPSDPADASDIATSFSTVNATLSTIAGYIDTEVAAIKAKTDLIPAAPAAVGDIPTAAVIADAVHDEVVEGSTTLRQSIRLHNSALGGKASGLATTNPLYRDLADTKNRINATVDADGNRSAITVDLT